MKVLLGIIAASLLACGFSFGVYYGQVTHEPQIVEVGNEPMIIEKKPIEVVKPVYVEVPRYQYIERVKEVPVVIHEEVEVIREVEKEVPRKLRWWPSIETLEQWVSENRLPVVLIADSNGVIDLRSPRSDPRYDCDDYSEDLIELAERDGYRLMEVPVVNGMIFGTKVTNVPRYHVGTWTKVNNTYYYIEPVPGQGLADVIEVIAAD